MLQRYSTDSACAQLQHVKIGEKHAVCEIFMNLWSRELMYHHYSYIFNLEHSPVIKRYICLRGKGRKKCIRLRGRRRRRRCIHLRWQGKRRYSCLRGKGKRKCNRSRGKERRKCICSRGQARSKLVGCYSFGQNWCRRGFPPIQATFTLS